MTKGDAAIRQERGKLTSIALSLLCAVVAWLALASSAEARPHASVAWTLPHGVNEGVAIPFSWTGSHLGRKHRLVVQRPVGTAHTWQTILKLPSNSGSAELPGLSLGRYRLRLADLHGHRVLAQQVAGIGVYGSVPFTTLFRDYGEGPGVYTTPSASFPYIYWSGAGDLNAPSTAFTVTHNHCLAVHVAFVPGYANLPSYYDKSTVTGTVAVVQESRDPVSASAPYDGISSVDAPLVPGQSWSVIASHQGEFEPLIYLNGYAICDSTESFFSS